MARCRPAELDRLAGVADEVLADLVAEHARCVWEISSGIHPAGRGTGTPDRELPARLCACCPGRDECLEFELRTLGPTRRCVGGLAEDDRRAWPPRPQW